jgi:hypothetical protein
MLYGLANRTGSVFQIKGLLSSSTGSDQATTLAMVKDLYKQLEAIEQQIAHKSHSAGNSLDLEHTSVSRSVGDVEFGSQTEESSSHSSRSNVELDLRSSPTIQVERNTTQNKTKLKSATATFDKLTSTAKQDEAEIDSGDTDSLGDLPPCVKKSVRPVSGSASGSTPGSGSVASMSMSKRGLLDEIRKEKDDHRKQIR